MSGHTTLFSGVLFRRESDRFICVRTEQLEHKEWVVGMNSEALIESGAVQIGDTVSIWTNESNQGFPPLEQAMLDETVRKDIEGGKDRWCNVMCPKCMRVHV